MNPKRKEVLKRMTKGFNMEGEFCFAWQTFL